MQSCESLTLLKNLTSCGWNLHHPELHMQENKNDGLNSKIHEQFKKTKFKGRVWSYMFLKWACWKEVGEFNIEKIIQWAE